VPTSWHGKSNVVFKCMLHPRVVLEVDQVMTTAMT